VSRGETVIDPRSASLRQRVAAREELTGSFVFELPARATIECYALAGFDFVVLDLEHSAIDLGALSMLIAACDAVGIACLVRAPAGDVSSITRILDMAPSGVMIPGVRSAGEAAAAVTAARYHPAGRRGLAPIVRHELSTGSGEGIAAREALTTVVVQIEAADALPEAAAVASMEGVDVVFVGPYDLSQSVGHPGELDHPEVVAAGQRLAEQVAPHAALGVYVERPEQIGRWRAAGASFFTLRTDGRIFLDACRRTLEQFRAG
jgi:4-hydroxy-2-oxoheptanedioate aldolase